MEDYKKKVVLGSGSYGKVFLVEEKKTGKQFAMKVIDVVDKNVINSLMNEVTLMKKLGNSHPNIARYEGSFYDNFEHVFVILMEYCSGGTLGEIIHKYKEARKKILESKVLEYLAQIILAMNLIHENKIIHRDLNPNNILIDSQGRIKIADFGISLMLTNTKTSGKTGRGTQYYASLELLKGESYKYDVDMWALGCIAHELCCLVQPYVGNNEYQQVDLITNNPYDSSVISEEDRKSVV